MMGLEGFTLIERDVKRVGRMLTDYERSQGGRAEGPRIPQFASPYRPPILVMLLDSVNSGDPVQAIVLEDVTTNETQTLTAYGQPGGLVTDYFRLGFRPVASQNAVEWTSRIDPIKDTAEDIQTKLEALPSLSPGDVLVSGGGLFTTIDSVDHWPNRWLFTFSGNYAGVDVALLELDQHILDAQLEIESYSILEDSGRVETVRECLGVGIPTPIRAGARALCHWVHGIGYVIGSVEARDYGDYGLMR